VLLHQSEGAFSVIMLTKDAIYGVRDKFGLRPLCIGEIVSVDPNKLNGGFVLASESCALSVIGAKLVRDVRPGEIVRIDKDGIHYTQGIQAAAVPAFCIFEYVYFARPDSIIESQSVHQVRQRLGKQLAKEHPAYDCDIVIGVPDSSTPMAIGYSQQSGIPFTEGLTKNRYIARTFIQPDNAMRREQVYLKYNALIANLEGKNIVLVDDSIVRGNTLENLVKLLKVEGKAKLVHVRISSPPVTNPCHMGIDMKTKDELVASSGTIDQIRELIGADSLGYLSHDGMMAAVREGISETAAHEKGVVTTYCSACFTGIYPLDIEDSINDC